MQNWQKMSKNRFVMPGTSCGVLNSIKILHEFPQDDEKIKPCTILDLKENHRESPINIDTIAASTTATPTTTTPATTTTTITATTTTTTTTTIPTTTTSTSSVTKTKWSNVKSRVEARVTIQKIRFFIVSNSSTPIFFLGKKLFCLLSKWAEKKDTWQTQDVFVKYLSAF